MPPQVETEGAGGTTLGMLKSRWEEHRAAGLASSAEDLCPDSPEMLETLREAIAGRLVDLAGSETRSMSGDPQGSTEAFGDGGGGNAEGLGPPQTPGEIGRLGPFRVVRLLGAGGMGTVFQAIDP